MLTKAFAKAMLERAIKTFAQTLVAMFSGQAVGVLDVDWGKAASIAGMAALLSVLTSVASTSFGGDGPSLTDAEKLNPAA